jgi:Xaa-Pro aminopeptidase
MAADPLTFPSPPAVGEVGAKLAAVRGWLGQRDLEAVLIASQAGFAWVTGGGRSHVSIGGAEGIASVLVTAGRAYLITTNIELQRLVDEETAGLPFEGIEYPWHRSEGLAHVIGSVCDAARIVSDLPTVGLNVADESFTRLRFILGPEEIGRYRALGRDAAEAVEAACREAEPGDTEYDVAARIAFECVRRDILPLVDLVAADERIARYRHPLPTSNRIGRTLLAALTGRRHGLHASLTRMVSFGAPDDHLASRHAAVCRVDASEQLASRPGATLGAVIGVAIAQYETEGFPGEWRFHHQGGLTGYAGREIFATPEEPHRLEAGQALAWNPSITRVKSEDTTLVTDEGVEVLTRTGKWPHVQAKTEVGVIERPALLVKGETE